MKKAIVHSTEQEQPDLVKKTSNIKVLNEVTIRYDWSIRSFVLSTVSPRGGYDVAVQNTLHFGTPYWKKPNQSVLYFRGINFVGFTINRGEHCILYWTPKIFGVFVVFDTNDIELKNMLSSYVRKVEEFADIGIVPFKLMRLISELGNGNYELD